MKRAIAIVIFILLTSVCWAPAIAQDSKHSETYNSQAANDAKAKDEEAAKEKAAKERADKEKADKDKAEADKKESERQAEYKARAEAESRKREDSEREDKRRKDKEAEDYADRLAKEAADKNERDRQENERKAKELQDLEDRLAAEAKKQSEQKNNSSNTVGVLAITENKQSADKSVNDKDKTEAERDAEYKARAEADRRERAERRRNRRDRDYDDSEGTVIIYQPRDTTQTNYDPRYSCRSPRKSTVSVVFAPGSGDRQTAYGIQYLTPKGYGLAGWVSGDFSRDGDVIDAMIPHNDYFLTDSKGTYAIEALFSSGSENTKLIIGAGLSVDRVLHTAVSNATGWLWNAGSDEVIRGAGQIGCILRIGGMMSLHVGYDTVQHNYFGFSAEF